MQAQIIYRYLVCLPPDFSSNA